MSETSIVEYFSGHDGYKCGYCKAENTCYSFGMWAHTLRPLDYQNLIDRGWRRSGKYCYKPTMHLTCCPQYAIRCESLRFTLSRSQKKVLKKVHRFLSYGEQERSMSSQPSEGGEQTMDVSEVPEQLMKDIKKVSEIKKSNIESMSVEPSNHEVTDISSKQDKDVFPSTPSTMPSGSDSSQINVSSHAVKSNPDKPCRKAKELRRERKLQKLLNKGIPAEEAMSSIQKKSCEPKTIENFLAEPFPLEPVHKLELRLVPSTLGNPLFSQTFEASYSVYKKYQMTIHKSPPDKCSENQFIRFLVKNPFQRIDGVSSSETSIYGLFHQQYWLNDKLIAVGVLDVLPYCVSSVYFYYDPDYSFLSLGTYASLREIALTRELNKTYPDIQYYYMGFYIHSCVKMRYKGQYYPSYLLCPETYIFQPIEKCKPKLDVAKYHRLEEDLNREDSDGVVNLHEVVVLYNHKEMTYLSYKKVNKHANDEEIVKEYAGFVGKKCYKKMMLFRSS